MSLISRVGRVLARTSPPILVSGCVSLGNLSPSLELPAEIDARRFTACMAPHVASMEPGFEHLVTSLGGLPTAGILNAKLGPLLELDPGILQNQWNLHSRLRELLAALSSDIHLVRRSDHHSEDISEQIRKNAQHFADRLQFDSKKAQKRTEAYLRAYFTRTQRQNRPRAGLDGEHRSRLGAALGRLLGVKPDDPRVDQAITVFDAELATRGAAGKESSESGSGFIGADGTVYAFPGITGEPGGSIAIDHSQIGADFIRIVFEAVRDHYAPLPVVKNSTAAWLTHQCAGPSPAYCDFKGERITELDWGDCETAAFSWHPDRTDRLPGFTGTIDRATYEDLEATARNAEATTAGAVGKAIRGGSFGSLNNEAVARVIETAAGVLARHTVERAQWCIRYAAKADGTQPRPMRDE